MEDVKEESKADLSTVKLASNYNIRFHSNHLHFVCCDMYMCSLEVGKNHQNPIEPFALDTFLAALDGTNNHQTPIEPFS